MRRAIAALVGRGRAGDRPPFFTLLFWIGALAPFAGRLTPSPDPDLPPLALLVATWIALVALWPLLDWSPGGGAWQSWAFVACALAFGTADGSGTNLPVLWIALAHVAFTRSLRAVAVAALGLLVGAGLSMILLFRRTWNEALWQLVGSAIAFVFFALLADVIARERRERHRVSALVAQLESANAALQEKNAQVRELAVAEERARLAREVHDAVGHHLTVVKLGLTNAQRLRDRDPDAAWTAVADARAAAGTALDEVRRAVRALGPKPLASASLGSALGLLASSYGTPTLAVDVNVTGEVDRLPPATEATLYRVCEEALTNVHRHAVAATRAAVRLSYAPDAVRLDVTDDGRGTATPTEGFGLAGARSRLADVGGTLAVTVAPGGGVRVSAGVPLGVTP